MKNTIEKALQKQKEAKAASQNTSSTEKLEDANHSNVPEESKVSIDKPAPVELPAETVIADERNLSIRNLHSTNLLSILPASIRMGIFRLTVRENKLMKSTEK